MKKQINHEAQFYHRAYKNNSLNNFDYILYKNLGFEYRASKPFSRFSRIEGGLVIIIISKQSMNLIMVIMNLLILIFSFQIEK